MNSSDFEKELKDLVPLVSRHASDFFKLSDCKNIRAAFKKIDHAAFLKKCYEGFKIAQKKLVSDILIVETEIRTQKNLEQASSKGRREPELRKDVEYSRILKSIRKSEFQKATFQEVANVMVWTLLLMERTHIRSFLKEDGGSGYLQDRNIQSVVKVADEINKAEDQFALISDITSVLHVGDLLIAEMGKITIAEVKEDTATNDKLLKIMESFSTEDNTGEDLVKEFISKSPKHGLKHITRYINQIIRGNEITKYIKTDQMYDHDLKLERKAYEPISRSMNLSELVNLTLEHFYNENRTYLIFPTDCCYIGIFKRSTDASNFTNRLDFQHHIYHAISRPWDECNYSTPPAKGSSREEPPEMFIYKDIELYSLREKIFIPTHRPIFLTLNEKYAVDLILERIDIFIFFNHERFLKMIKERNLQYTLINEKQALSVYSHSMLQSCPMFERKYLLLGNGLKVLIGWGSIFDIIYEFESGNTTINHLKDSLKITRHPILYKTALKILNFLRRINKKV